MSPCVKSLHRVTNIRQIQKILRVRGVYGTRSARGLSAWSFCRRACIAEDRGGRGASRVPRAGVARSQTAVARAARSQMAGVWLVEQPFLSEERSWADASASSRSKCLACTCRLARQRPGAHCSATFGCCAHCSVTNGCALAAASHEWLSECVGSWSDAAFSCSRSVRGRMLSRLSSRSQMSGVHCLAAYGSPRIAARPRTAVALTARSQRAGVWLVEQPFLSEERSWADASASSRSRRLACTCHLARYRSGARCSATSRPRMAVGRTLLGHKRLLCSSLGHKWLEIGPWSNRF